MHRFPLAAGWSLAAMIAFAPVTRAETENQTWNREFTVALKPTVRIKTDDARVTIRSWKDAQVRVRVERRGHTEGLVLGRRRPLVEIGQQRNEVSVLARMEGSTSGIVFNSSRLEVEVWLPTESNLIVDTEDGPVSVEEVSGHIQIDTEDGSLVARGLKGDIQIHSEDGRIELDDLDGSLRLETEDGHSEVRGRFDRLDVESADGGIDIEVLHGSKLREEWSVRSQDGGIRLRIPHDLAATIDARTADGGLSVDLPVQLQGRVRRHELVGDLNGGGPTLRLRCDDGSIRVTALD